MSINEKLKAIVDERGIKQSYLCQKTGMSADCISRILNSTRKITADEFLNLCDVLEIDPRAFRKTA
jgi:DNA-binding Xre family transcriptional regulator